MQVHLLVILFTGSTDDPSIHPSILHKKEAMAAGDKYVQKEHIINHCHQTVSIRGPVITGNNQHFQDFTWKDSWDICI